MQSLIEIKKILYSEIPETDGNHLYQVDTTNYIQTNKDYSYRDLQYTNNGQYTSVAIKNKNNFDFASFASLKSFENIDINNKYLKNTGFLNKCNSFNKELFEKNIFLYFPCDRYYYPTWINKRNKKLIVSMVDAYVNKSDNSMVQYNLLEDIETWIMDVLFDSFLLEQKSYCFKKKDQTIYSTKFEGRNTQILNQINKIIQIIFSSHKEYTSVKLGISSKRCRELQIVATDKDGKTIELSPTFHNLSSGQVMILALFCRILKEADRLLASSTSLDTNKITGIVLIDEIDCHLHSLFSKNVLPEIIALFPRIQFIISSHSPFFLLGMKQKFGEKCTFLSMPDGSTMTNVEDFEEIQKCYEMLNTNHNELLASLQSTKEKLRELQKPLIITEGKTDWKHIKAAIDHFKNEKLFTDLDIDFLEYENDFGDNKLETLLENLSKVSNTHKIIGIFDSDTKIGKKYKSPINFGNKVFGICLPDNPKYPNGISIEFLYDDNDIKKTTKDGKRLFIASEFTEDSHKLIADYLTNTTGNQVEGYYKSGIIKIIDENVFDGTNKNIALSKNEFAKMILNKEPPFDDMDFSLFEPLLKSLEKIINENN